MQSPKILQKSCRTSKSGHGSRAYSFLLKNFVEILAWDHSPLYTVVDNGCPSCKMSPVLQGNAPSLFLFRMSTSFELNLLTWVPDGGIVLRSSVSSIKRSPVQLLTAVKAYPMNWTFLPNWCTRPWSFDGSGSNFTSAPNGIIGNWTDVHEASGHLKVVSFSMFRIWQQYSMDSAHLLSWSPGWTNTDEVPLFTPRTARSTIPCVSDLCDVDISWF